MVTINSIDDELEGSSAGARLDHPQTSQLVDPIDAVYEVRLRDGNNRTASSPQESGDGAEENDPPPEQSINGSRQSNAICFRFGTLNIRGLDKAQGQRRHKLDEIASAMIKRQWGVIALQETHIATSKINRLKFTNPNVLAFGNNGAFDTAGTMVLVNKLVLEEDVDISKIKNKILIEGRAQIVRIPSKAGTTNIVNVYLPNNDNEAIQMLEKLMPMLENTRVDIIMGDWNFVEHRKDRVPDPGPPPANLLRVFNTFKDALNVIDGSINEDSQAAMWTYVNDRARNGLHSSARLDRVYTSPAWTSRTAKWHVASSMMLSDHNIALIDTYDDEAPYSQKGPWRLDPMLLYDEECHKQNLAILRKCERHIKNGVPPLKAWLQAKIKICNTFKTKEEQIRKDRGKRLEQKRVKVKLLHNAADFGSNAEKQSLAKTITQEIASIEKLIIEKSAEKLRVKHHLHGETVSKFFLKKGKRKKVPIMALQNDSGVQTRSTRKMVEIARNNYQKIGKSEEPTPEKDEATKIMLDQIDSSLNEEEKSNLQAKIESEDISRHIFDTPNGVAPGLDGLTYEFYKHWDALWKTSEDDDPYPNISAILEAVYNDVWANGSSDPEYLRGLLLPIHKKGDKTDIKNYRPITLLNSDYKIMTRIWAKRFGDNFGTILHEDQAGFVPGRDIMNHIKDAEITIEYCDNLSIKGALVCLDQEKAYDRIDHEYLFKCMSKYGIPESVIKLVKTCYSNSYTSVIINGVVSEEFQVTRGVRQGDPMSCLLFNIAIEPLANAIRKSGIRGITPKSAIETIKIKLFADDTNIYLSDMDMWRDVNVILKTWCCASTAKFNEHKTEIVPLGNEIQRNEIRERRKINALDDVFDESARIAKDNTPTRILGGYVGKSIDQSQIWENCLNKMKKTIETWSSKRLTLKGKGIVTSTLVLSQATYLLMTNPPPETVLNRIERLVRKFIWNNKRSSMTLEQLYKPWDDGGINLPSIRGRNATSKIEWLKRWRKDGNNTIWTKMLDELVKRDVKKSRTKRLDESMLEDMYLQKWRHKKTKQSTLSRPIRDMLKIGELYNIHVDALDYGVLAKESIPVWHSIAFKNSGELTHQNSPAAIHLRKEHNVRFQKDLRPVYNDDNCVFPNCKTKIESLEETVMEKYDLRRIRVPPMAPDPIVYKEQRGTLMRGFVSKDTLIHQGTLKSSTRIFGPKVAPSTKAAEKHLIRPISEKIAAWTDGSADKNGFNNSNCGAGIVVPRKPELTHSLHVKGQPPTNIRGELAAVVSILNKIPFNQPIRIHTDCQYVIDFAVSNIEKSEDKGYFNEDNVDILKRLAYLLKIRSAVTDFAKVKAHDTDKINEAADKLAKEGLNPSTQSQLDLTVPKEWQLSGSKLSTLTYNEIYKRVMKPVLEFEYTNAREWLDLIGEHIFDRTDGWPRDNMIWDSLRRDPIRRETGDFLWKIIHNKVKCGTFFLKYQGWEDKANCIKCGEIEDIEHILEGCIGRPWVNEIWEHALDRFDPKRHDDVAIPEVYETKLINILSANILKKSSTRGRRWVIIITETAYTIWLLRCREVIDSLEITNQMAISFWERGISRRRATELGVLDMAQETIIPNKSEMIRMEKSTVLIGPTWDDFMVPLEIMDHEDTPLTGVG